MRVGSVYLSYLNEIGVFVKKEHQKKGYAKAAIREIMRSHPLKHYLANVSPRNENSMRLFRHLGFNLVQHTYKIKPQTQIVSVA